MTMELLSLKPSTVTLRPIWKSKERKRKVKRRIREAKAISDQIEANQCPRTDHLSFTKHQACVQTAVPAVQSASTRQDHANCPISAHRPPSPAVRFYTNALANSPVRAILQRHGRLARPPSRPVHVSAPAYSAVADSLSTPAYKRRG